ncbi:MAG: hypothetical protein K0R17_480 [Rariglobus sp.]|jgi:uncharacterized protein YqgC (DUF456 family)|nr:hypothetical protein [Rariglobus sp.]
MEVYLVWTLTIVLTLVGLAGVVLPLLPGTTLILIAMIVHKLLLPGDVSWAVIGWIAGFWFLSVLIDFLGVILGTRLFGGGKWGMAGAGGGAMIGMFFSLPMLILGTVLGAVAAEKLIAKKTHRASLLAGAGAAVGFLISTVGRLLCAFVMIALFLWAAWTAVNATPAVPEFF